MTARTPVEYRRALRIAGALVGLATALGACTHTDTVARPTSAPAMRRARRQSTGILAVMVFVLVPSQSVMKP